jgi:hypothetical protein
MALLQGLHGLFAASAPNASVVFYVMLFVIHRTYSTLFFQLK